MKFPRGFIIVISLFLFACSTTIDSTNPFDPEAPSTLKMKGEISGQIEPEEPSDLQNYQFTVSLKDTSYNSLVEKDGSFVIKDVPEGSYVLRIVSTRLAYNHVEQGPYEVKIGSKLDVGKLNISLKKGSLRGFVVAEKDFSQKGVGVNGVNVFLLNSEAIRSQGIVMLAQSDNCENATGSRNYYSSTTSGDGSFYFSNVVVGRYRVNPVDSILGIGYSSEVEVKENSETDVGEVKLVGPSAILHIEDPDVPNQIINVTNKTTVKAVYMTGDFVNSIKLSLDGDLNSESYKLIDQQAGSELINVPDVNGEHILRVRFRDIFCRESPIYETRFYYDNLSPLLKSLTIYDLNDGYINRQNLRIEVDVEDNYHRSINDYSTLKMRFAVISSNEISGEITQEKLSSYLNSKINYDNFSNEFTADITGEDGEKIFIVQFKDLAGNESEIYYKKFIYDTTAPKFSVDILNSVKIGNDDYINTPVANIVINVDNKDEIEFMKIFREGEVEPANWEFFRESNTITFLGDDGKKSFSVRLRDKAKNESELLVKSLYLDSTPPVVVSIKLNDNNEYTNNENIKVELDVNGASEMRISEDGSFSNTQWESYVNSKIIGIANNEGLHTIYFQFKDSVGNITGNLIPIYRNLILDKTPPEQPVDIYLNGKISSPAEKIFTNSSSIYLNWSMVDSSDVSKYIVKINQIVNNQENEILSITSTTNQISIPSISDGEYTAYIYAIDKANNVGKTSEKILFEVDTIPPSMPGLVQPVFSKMNLEEKYCNNNTSYYEVSIAVKSDDRNIDRYEMSGGFNINNCSIIYDFVDASDNLILDNQGNPIKIKIYPIRDSLNNIQLRVRDKAGNYSNTAFVYFSEDSTPPGKVSYLSGMNADSSVLIRWKPPVDNNSDIVGYKIYYGYGKTKGELNGDFSDKGNSPINVGMPCNNDNNEFVCSFWLTGIPNNVPFYLNVSAYDNTQDPQALEGELSDIPLRLMAGELSPDEIKEITLNDIGADSGSMIYGIDERDGILYITTRNTSGFGGVYAVDISHPYEPQIIISKNLADFKDMFGIKVYGNYGYIANGDNGVYIIRLTDFNVVSNISFKSGERAVALDLKGNYLFVGNNTEGISDGNHLYIYDISNPENPELVSQYRASLPEFDKITDVKVQGNILYLLNQNQKMVTLDITEINDPSKVNLYDGGSIFINGQNLLLSADRMYLLKYKELSFLRYQGSGYEYENNGSISLLDTGLDIDVNGNYIYVNTVKGINIFKKEKGSKPISSVYSIKLDNSDSIIINPYLSKPLKSIIARGNLLFVTYNGLGKTGVKIYNLSVPRSPKIAGESGISIGGGYDIALYKDNLLFANYTGKFVIAELYSNNSPEVIYTSNSKFYPDKVYYKEGMIFASGYNGDNKNSEIYEYVPNYNGVNQKLIYSTATYEKIIDIGVTLPYVYIGVDNDPADHKDAINEIRILDLRSGTIKKVFSINTDNWPAAVYRNSLIAIMGNVLFVNSINYGIIEYDISDRENPIQRRVYPANISNDKIEYRTIDITASFVYITGYNFMSNYSFIEKFEYSRGRLNKVGEFKIADQDNVSKNINKIILSGGYIFAGLDTGDVYIFDDNLYPKLLSIFSTNVNSRSNFVLGGNILYNTIYMSNTLIVKLE